MGSVYAEEPPQPTVERTETTESTCVIEEARGTVYTAQHHHTVCNEE